MCITMSTLCGNAVSRLMVYIPPTHRRSTRIARIIFDPMKLSPSLLALASDSAASPAGPAARCEAANFRWEQAVADERADDYNDYVGTIAAHKDWKAEHWDYLSQSVHIARDLPKCAESFMDRNRLAHLNEGMDNTFLLRLESLGPLFSQPLISGDVANRFWERFYKSQKDLRKDKLSDVGETLRAELVAQWNKQRLQARPMFATFLNSFGGDLPKLVKADWPHILRDHLGLRHWPSTAGKPLPVALMCYTVEEVRDTREIAKKKGAAASFTRPTVLDGEMSAAFIPAPLLPGGESYGYTLDLSETGVPVEFSPELLTFPIEYQPRHIKALGFITREHALQDDQTTLEARNRHVQGLRAWPDCNDFGEVLP